MLHTRPLRVAVSLMAGAALRAAGGQAPPPASPPPASPSPAAAAEVRQFVTFRFVPGRSGDALAIYRDSLLPVYRDLEPLRRFRLYREAESPVPLDVIVESTYAGMAGMDAGNAALRRPHRSGVSAFRLYGVLSAMTLAHTDEFVAMRPRRAAPATASLTVFESVRLVPGATARYETLLREVVEPWEAAHAPARHVESGRYLVADGWDYLRIHTVSSLAEIEAWREAERTAPFAAALGALVAARRVIVVRRDAAFDVR